MKTKSICKKSMAKKPLDKQAANSIKQARIICKSIKIGSQSWLINLTFLYIHINALFRKAISKATTMPSHAHICSSQTKVQSL